VFDLLVLFEMASLGNNVVEVVGPWYPVEVKLATQYSLYGKTENAVGLVEVKGTVGAAPQNGGTVPVEVVYVVDKSGSMGDSEKPAMPILNAALEFVGQSTPIHHKVGIVAFNGNATVHWPLTKMTPEAKQLLKAKQRLVAEGYTNIASALYQGLCQFTARPDSGDNVQRTIVLLSDGTPTQGPRTLEEIMQTLQRHPLLPHVHIFTMCMGTDVDRKLMSDLALRTNGKMYFVQNVDQLPSAFGDCLGTLLTLSASNLAIEIEAEQEEKKCSVAPLPQASALRSRSAAVPSHLDQSRIEFNLGSIYQGEQRDVLVDFPPRCPGFIVRVRFLDVNTGEPTTIERRINIPRVDSDTVPSSRVECADVGIQLMRTEGQQTITRCADSGTTEGLTALRDKIMQGPYAAHPVAVCLLADITRLLDLYASAVAMEECECEEEEEDGQVHELFASMAAPRMQRSFTQRPQNAAYRLACATTSVSMRTQQNDRTSSVGVPDLRRNLSDECTQYSSVV